MPRRWFVLPDSWRQRYQQWLSRRIPRRREVQLTQRNLFIFLSRQGVYFLLLDALLWIGATNFQNNLAYALSFFLLAVLFVAILQTFANASGLRLRFVDVEPVFAGAVAQVRLELASTILRRSIQLLWPNQPAVEVSVFANEPLHVMVPHRTQRRGQIQLGRLRLQSVYPLGVMRCWSWLDLDVQLLVYPQPIEASLDACCVGENSDGNDFVAGSDEYFSLKPYATGEPYSRIAWKQFAAGRGLFVREYADKRGGDVVLDFSVMKDADTEVRLSKLCFCACRLHEQGRAFGLQLPNQPAIAVNSGDAHLRAVLTALAVFVG